MDEYQIIRGMLLRIGRGITTSHPRARAIKDWVQPHTAWLLGETRPAGKALGWTRLMTGIDRPRAMTDTRPEALALADDLARLLVLAPFDAALLTLMIACDRLPRVAALAKIAVHHGHSLPELLGELSGAEPQHAERMVRKSAILRLGLIGFFANRQGEVEVDIRWTLERLLDRAPGSGPEFVDTLVGKRQPATLTLDDFASVADADYLVRLIAGAVGARAAGVNILIHGPPGTGKTELARTLAATAGVPLHGIGEVDEDGDEPTRWERINALQIAQRLLAGHGEAVLLFDEMEDLIGDTRPSGGDWFARREGSKVFVNRMLEANPVPVIWTTNAIGNIDVAILRRMSFVLKLDLPSRAATQRMLGRIAADEGVVPGHGFDRLIAGAPESGTVLRVATRAARLAGEDDGGVKSTEALLRAIRGGELPLDGPRLTDLALFESDLPIAPLFAAISDAGHEDVSLLLTGPPGTGKTALAYHLARTLDRPLVVKRASDLLSKWVGETEARIADAFAEARRQEGVLLLDEADSLLFDRTTAKASWEVSQVNELLTWLDRHPLPVVAATNHPRNLDPATLRRFVFKLALRPLGAALSARAFEHFFAMAPPAALAELTNLTPGDFAVVARQLRHAPANDAAAIVERLRGEAIAKPEGGGRIGFG